MKWVALIAMAAGMAHSSEPGGKAELQFRSDAKAICEHQSTKRGSFDQEAFNFCIKQQGDAYSRIEWANSTLGSKEFYRVFIYPYCYKRGTKRDVSDSSSIAYCIKDEVDAFEDVVYFAKKYDEEKVMNIAYAQMRRFGAWRMASYELKRTFEPSP